MDLIIAFAFVAALVLIAADWLHRTAIVFVGAAGFVLFGVLDQEAAFASIDLATIGLLIGMMVIVAATEPTGVFEHIALVGLRISRGRPFAVVLSMTFMTALLSAFLDNLTAILLVAPISIIIASKLGMEPVPLLALQIIGSNIGGTATLIGDPPNIMIAGATGLSFGAFIVNLAPVAVISLVVVTLGLYALQRRRFAVARAVLVTDIQPEVTLAKGRDLWVPVSVLLLTIAGFFLHGILHIEVATVALSGAALMLAVRARDLHTILGTVDWATLLFFAGLFVMVGGLEHAGIIGDIAAWTKDVTAGSRPAELFGIMGIAAVGSAFVDNIPFTAAMIPVVHQLASDSDTSHWWALAMGACFGGNATIVAAAANVACQGVAERHGVRLSFAEFLRWGVPATVVSLGIGASWIALFHL